MHEDRVIDLIKFVLGSAGQENPGEQELGVIHVIKFLYLLDLDHARRHQGETFTSIKWRFHHYGPWERDAWMLVERTLQEVGAELRTFESTKFEGEGRRWKWTGDDVDATVEEIRRKLPLRLTQAARRLVHEFGADTPLLLHHVYRTGPMLRAAPEESLTFDALSEEPPPPRTSVSAEPALSKKQERLRKKRAAALRARVKASIVRRLAEHVSSDESFTAPRYDAVFFQGVGFLEAGSGQPVLESEGELEVDDSVWQSETRGRSDVS